MRRLLRPGRNFYFSSPNSGRSWTLIRLSGRAKRIQIQACRLLGATPLKKAPMLEAYAMRAASSDGTGVPARAHS